MTILKSIGKTPLVKLKNPYGDGYGQVYLKMEEFNPGGSIKSRVGNNVKIPYIKPAKNIKLKMYKDKELFNELIVNV
ncbi:MAG: hypothetical protein K6D38_03205 [Pseudobutyrivibrio sp.]|nr:hypothetical protein [Pseudobutyrivibrio sp.]